MTLTELLRSKLNLPNKYTLNLTPGNESPRPYHEDASREDYYTGKPTKYAKTYGGKKWNKYVAAVNEILVGKAWIEAACPGWEPKDQLTGEQARWIEYIMDAEERQKHKPAEKTTAQRWAEDSADDLDRQLRDYHLLPGRVAPPGRWTWKNYQYGISAVHPVYAPYGDTRDNEVLAAVQHSDRFRGACLGALQRHHNGVAWSGVAGPWEYSSDRKVRYVGYDDPRDAQQFLAEENTERRRMIWEAVGTQMLANGDIQADLIHSDDFGDLYSMKIDYQTYLVVKVINATPEPDGTYKDYWLRVPPNMDTAHEAVAWTFGMTEAEYQPACES